ncbi:catechol O-methyltransferase-like [Branchiostoma lanceolatum]|uniref:catechol O-methyltransferase-like n=1 Tax=Branchiostoma lanceolatum TaxID=7740 RepID=UPI00345326C3
MNWSYLGTALVIIVVIRLVKAYISNRWGPVLVPMLEKVFGTTKWEELVLQHVKKHAVAGDPDSVMQTFDNLCTTRKWTLKTAGKRGEMIDSVICDTKPQVCLEMGTSCGYTAVRIGRLLAPGARLLTLEPNPQLARVSEEMLQLAGLQDKVTVITADADDVIPHLTKKYDVTNIDIVFLDYWKDSYIRDLKLIEEHGLLKNGFVVVTEQIGDSQDTDHTVEYNTGAEKFECILKPVDGDDTSVGRGGGHHRSS